MLSGDLCKRSTPRVELDQRARDTRLGLEQIERLVVRAPDRCFRLRQTFIMSARASTFLRPMRSAASLGVPGLRL
jgi:hypothetical protein